MKYRSKQDPARVVDAVQWTGDNAAEVVAWGKANEVELRFRPDGTVKFGGCATIDPGDWAYAIGASSWPQASDSAFSRDYEPYAPSATELATRGEWHYDSEGYVRPAGDEKCVALIASWCGTEQRNANGRLMAASKDLYDAAKAAQKALNGLPNTLLYCRRCPRPASHTELIADLTKAIAKADFGSQE